MYPGTPLAPNIGGQSVFSAFWAGHCAVHAYSPVVLLRSVLGQCERLGNVLSTN